MLNKLPEALATSNMGRCRQRGFSLHNTLCSIGQELNSILNDIRASLPLDYLQEFESLQDDLSFNLQRYITSFISGEAVTENGIDTNEYNLCQTRLIAIQDYLKRLVSEIEEKLK